MAIDLEGTGLALLGHCQLNQADGLPHDAGTLLLLGPDEPAFWPLFKASPERNDGQPDPLELPTIRLVMRRFTHFIRGRYGQGTHGRRPSDFWCTRTGASLCLTVVRFGCPRPMRRPMAPRPVKLVQRLAKKLAP